MNDPVNLLDPRGLKISQVWKPLAGGLWILGYHTAISVNGEIYGFSSKGVHLEDSNDYGGWGSHENVIYKGDEYDQSMLDYLRNAEAGNNPRFTDETYSILNDSCMSFVGCSVSDVLGDLIPTEESTCH